MTTTIHKSTNAAATMNNETTPLFATDYKVYINHTDAGGIVYHANHLVFFENCRRDWFTKLGLNGYFLQTDAGDVQHFVVSQADLQYKKAILLDEVINVRIDKVELKPASIIFYQSIHRHTADNNAKTSNSLLSSTKIVIACVQNQIRPESISKDKIGSNDTGATATPMRPIRVPQTLRTTIEQAIAQHIAE
ncbi:thioesterase family protein [Psychrobacter sp. AOP22-C1-22]|uniref:thioesterase family protein n=1 Tax=unclassified Psychrobacter TaxID=196806 RepID=UPI001787B100|nr:thioesterase family protein [Psychrobacter sp. FME6]MBE0443857.1 thioesterase family protein [Psychrobacter sp. FME5]